SKRPFFSSTQPLNLSPIPAEKYLPFIQARFASGKRKIQPDALRFIGEWTRFHTYYTQVVCNRIYSTDIKLITLEVARQECSNLLNEQTTQFLQYRNLLTSGQWNLLKAIARENKVYKPTARKFLADHPVGTPANVQRALEALLTKEMIFKEQDQKGSYYCVYDCFLSRWLEKQW
ncbi:MAG: ATP-binding protein, partial [Bacteroidota bacterium]|nr:ATP-binding protein [Bacteroidota bacterium]